MRVTLLNVLDKAMLVVEVPNGGVRGGWQAILMVRVPELPETGKNVLGLADTLLVGLQEAATLMAEDWAELETPLP